jgi:DNA-binding NarL/FixJ family response regulator
MRTALVASGDRLLAAAAGSYLEQHGWTVVAIALDGLQALAAMARYSPSAVLIMGTLPRLGPTSLARQIRRRNRNVTVVVVGEATDSDAAVLPPEARGQDVLDALGEPPTSVPTPDDADRPNGVALLRSLTARERVVLQHLAEGLPLRAIARRLGLSHNTIRTHMQNLYAKLGAHSRLDVLRFAAQHGLFRDVDESAR